MSRMSGEVIGPIGVLFDGGTAVGVTDGVLLERFLAGPGEVSELAFAALVERHGPMVLRVCRSVLAEPHDAEDAFQATFLVLARRARSIRKRGSLASWLHGAAARTAGCARAAAARRHRHERAAAARSEIAFITEPPDDLAGTLHEELDRLPERLRAPILLCHLEGLSHEQAAEALAWPVGTVRSRLSRGRERLRGRLIRRGVAPAIAALWASDAAARAAIPAVLAIATARAAVSSATAPWKTAGMVPPSVIVLVEGALNAMLVTRIKLAAIACAGLAAGTVALARPSGGVPVEHPRPAASTTATYSNDIEPTLQDVPPSAAYVAKVGDDDLETDAEVRQRIGVEMLTEEVAVLQKHVKDTIRFKAQKRRKSTPEEMTEAADAYAQALKEYEAKSLALAAARREMAEARKRKDDAPKPANLKRDPGAPQAAKAEAPETQSPAPRLGSINIDIVFKEYEKLKVKSDEFRSTADTRKAELQKLQAEARGEEEQLARLVPGTVDYKKHENRVTELKSRFEFARESAQRELSEREARIMTSVLEEVEHAVAVVAKARGLNYVLRVSPGPANAANPADVQEATKRSILYADPANDLTEEVIRELNRKYKDEATKPGTK